jgi:predicted nucleotidyltransferase
LLGQYGVVAESDNLGAVVGDAVDALEEERIPYVLCGGLASTLLGRSRTTDDVDVLVQADDAERALEALARAGFETERTNPQWIFKATRDEITIDLMFWLKGGIVLDDEMLERAGFDELAGRRVRVIPPEDLIVVKAIANDEQSSRQWHDALGMIATRELDWPYLVTRARHGARRVLSLLTYAQADDLIVPNEAITALYGMVYGDGQAPDASVETASATARR